MLQKRHGASVTVTAVTASQEPITPSLPVSQHCRGVDVSFPGSPNSLLQCPEVSLDSVHMFRELFRHELKLVCLRCVSLSEAWYSISHGGSWLLAGRYNGGVVREPRGGSAGGASLESDKAPTGLGCLAAPRALLEREGTDCNRSCH